MCDYHHETEGGVYNARRVEHVFESKVLLLSGMFHSTKLEEKLC